MTKRTFTRTRRPELCCLTMRCGLSLCSTNLTVSWELSDCASCRIQVYAFAI